MFSFHDLTAQCSKCHRRTVVQAIGRQCQMTQPDGQMCDGRFCAPSKPKSEETLFFVVDETARVNPFPPPKVILTDRAKEAAAAAYDECEKGPRKSMQYAVEAAAGIIAADNVDVIRRGVASTAVILAMTGRMVDAEMLNAVVRMLEDFIASLDPNRPTDD